MSTTTDGMDLDVPATVPAAEAAVVDLAIEATNQEAVTLKREIDEDVKEVIEHEKSHDGGPVVKKVKLEVAEEKGGAEQQQKPERKKGVAPIKAEFLVNPNQPTVSTALPNDDAAEASSHPHTSNSATASSSTPIDDRDRPGNEKGKGGKKNKKKERGQNKNRKFTFAHDSIQLCPHISQSPSTDRPLPCQRIGSWNKKTDDNAEGEGDGDGDGEEQEGTGKARGGRNGCTFEHDIKKYVKEGKKEDLEGICPVWDVRGECPAAGWRCRWLKSHMRVLDNGEMELVVDESRKKAYLEQLKATGKGDEAKAVEAGTPEILNEVNMSFKILLRKNKFEFPKSKPYLDYIESQKDEVPPATADSKAENSSAYVEARFPSHEKRPLDFAPDKPILAPLTTTGNLPFRRLCTSLGAAMTYSEMAMSLPLLQGQKSEWALLRAHASETPNYAAQICASKLWQAVKATEAITTLLPGNSMKLIDLNCGCPIDMVYRSGGGSALLDQHGKLFKMLKGMSHVSGETPITCKIRMGTKDSSPTAKRLLWKLFQSGDVSAVTLHGRSRQQRYTREADWEYISECATLINDLKSQADIQVDTSAWKDGFDSPQVTTSGTSDSTGSGRVGKSFHFIGNGDVFSHVDYNTHLSVSSSGLSTCMLARGALIKPWLFKEITQNTYLDPSPSDRLGYISQFCRYGLDTWGSDEFGKETTRRFLLEWLSFTRRYVPTGVLEELPPRIQDRPPTWRGRDEMETRLASADYREWIKISEMFLGKSGDGFVFVPKHKSNSYDGVEAEG